MIFTYFLTFFFVFFSQVHADYVTLKQYSEVSDCNSGIRYTSSTVIPKSGCFATGFTGSRSSLAYAKAQCASSTSKDVALTFYSDAACTNKVFDDTLKSSDYTCAQNKSTATCFTSSTAPSVSASPVGYATFGIYTDSACSTINNYEVFGLPMQYMIYEVPESTCVPFPVSGFNYISMRISKFNTATQTNTAVQLYLNSACMGTATVTRSISDSLCLAVGSMYMKGSLNTAAKSITAGYKLTTDYSDTTSCSAGTGYVSGRVESSPIACTSFVNSYGFTDYKKFGCVDGTSDVITAYYMDSTCTDGNQYAVSREYSTNTCSASSLKSSVTCVSGAVPTGPPSGFAAISQFTSTTCAMQKDPAFSLFAAENKCVSVPHPSSIYAKTVCNGTDAIVSIYVGQDCSGTPSLTETFSPGKCVSTSLFYPTGYASGLCNPAPSPSPSPSSSGKAKASGATHATITTLLLIMSLIFASTMTYVL
jgi:hypothetical protein